MWDSVRNIQEEDSETNEKECTFSDGAVSSPGAGLDGWAQTKPRARDLGVPFDGNPGKYNAITDVVGVEVGETTLISGSGKLKVGEGPVRTGVTAVLPRGKNSIDPVFAGWFTLNGNGEMTGTTWVEDSGFLDGPVMITNTHSVGVVRDAVIAWRVKKAPPDEEGYWWSLPVVAETWDGELNDVNGFHVKPEHAWHALDTRTGGPVEEGNVGGGTGMICNEFKGGIGTRRRGCWTRSLAATPWACWCNATTDARTNCGSRACRWEKRFRIKASQRAILDRSSWCWQPMRR